MSGVGSVIAGILLVTLAGIFNGSWNAAFSPHANLAVGADGSRNDLTYHHAFSLYSFYAGIINIPVCICWAGGLERVNAIVEATPNTSILLVVLFSLLWGFGTLLFGLACKVAGVGLGTNLSMGTVAILGTLLPLITEKTLLSRTGAVISAGLLVCCAGLWFATSALKKRDEIEITTTSESAELAAEEAKVGIGINHKKIVEKENSDEPLARNQEDSVILQEDSYKTWQKIAICIFCGIFSVMVQFAFIFAKPIVDLASEVNNTVSLPGSTPRSGEAAIIWLFVFSLSTPISILYGIVASPVPISSSVRAPWWRHIRLILSTSIPWLSQIHLVRSSASKHIHLNSLLISGTLFHNLFLLVWNHNNNPSSTEGRSEHCLATADDDNMRTCFIVVHLAWRVE